MNRFGSNNFENEYDQFADNQRFGRQLAENNPRSWNESHIRRSSYQTGQYSEPWFRVPSHNRHTYEDRSRFGNQQHFYSGAHHDYPENDPAWRHHDDRIWRERNDYKDNDYRYRSGHRNYWHEDYDDMYEPVHQPHRRHPESFIEHVGQGIREGWNNLIHPRHSQERYENYQREHRRTQQPRHWPDSENYPDYDQRRQQQARAQERYQDEMRRRREEYRNRNQSPDWHNSGPDHRDEDFFDSRNFRI